MTGQAKKINVGLGVRGADAKELDDLTRSLSNELLQTDVRSVERASEGPAPEDSKGDPFTLGWLAVTLTPIVASKVIDILVDWTKRAHNRTIKVTLGEATIELSGATRSESETLLKKWLQEVDRGHSA